MNVIASQPTAGVAIWAFERSEIASPVRVSCLHLRRHALCSMSSPRRRESRSIIARSVATRQSPERRRTVVETTNGTKVEPQRTQSLAEEIFNRQSSIIHAKGAAGKIINSLSSCRFLPCILHPGRVDFPLWVALMNCLSDTCDLSLFSPTSVKGAATCTHLHHPGVQRPQRAHLLGREKVFS